MVRSPALLRLRKRFARDRAGTAIVEMALVPPLLLTLIMGIVSYGDWFLTAHGVQEAANDAARASIGGLSTAERATMASNGAQTSVRRAGDLDPAKVSVAVDDDGSTLVVHLTYDASADPQLHMSIVPLPPPTIHSSAAIKLESL